MVTFLLTYINLYTLLCKHYMIPGSMQHGGGGVGKRNQENGHGVARVWKWAKVQLPTGLSIDAVGVWQVAESVP